jgi:hypothetical protein
VRRLSYIHNNPEGEPRHCDKIRFIGPSTPTHLVKSPPPDISLVRLRTTDIMPLGITRLNERTQRPNPLINFIKGPDATSLDFLNRIAAQCYPIMKQNHISVMSLEEFPPNNEFLGRNFNAGEVIQLVLKDKQGRWLGFKFVQMVMMHELAHCKQMNHSKFFWQVRNGFAGEMEGLWAKNYVGEGMWGRGKDLVTGSFVQERELAQGDVPEHLCGGTYRRKGRKRKRGGHPPSGEQGDERPKLTYAERQQKRIAKKFGVHGEGAALGDDELLRGAYESASGKRHAGKPRVANSKRGRELRAQAALARFGAAKPEPVKEEADVKSEPGIKQEPEDSETDSDWDDAGFGGGQSVGESDMVKVCGDEGEDEDGAHNEMDELRKMSQKAPRDRQDDNPEYEPTEPATALTRPATSRQSVIRPADTHVDSDTESEPDDAPTATAPSKTTTKATTDTPQHATPPTQPTNDTEPQQSTAEDNTSTSQPGTCPICSLVNDPASPACMACSNVLQPTLMPDHWRCTSSACEGSAYINIGDAGRCGLCGAQKPKQSGVGGSRSGGSGGGTRPIGVIESDVLRWD